MVEGCSVEDCQGKRYAKELCSKHYERQRRTGTTADGPGRGSGHVMRIPTCGHPERKHRAHGLCNSCYMSQWMKAHPDANSGNGWLKRHPAQNRAHVRKLSLKKRGITPEDYDRLWAEQDGQCANPACDSTAPMVMPDYRQGLQVDHCHRSLAVRGLLCGGCNRALGDIDDSITRLQGLICYLEERDAASI